MTRYLSTPYPSPSLVSLKLVSRRPDTSYESLFFVLCLFGRYIFTPQGPFPPYFILPRLPLPKIFRLTLTDRPTLLPDTLLPLPGCLLSWTPRYTKSITKIFNLINRYNFLVLGFQKCIFGPKDRRRTFSVLDCCDLDVKTVVVCRPRLSTTGRTSTPVRGKRDVGTGRTKWRRTPNNNEPP